MTLTKTEKTAFGNHHFKLVVREELTAIRV